jgi:hypothetical protein
VKGKGEMGKFLEKYKNTNLQVSKSSRAWER